MIVVPVLISELSHSSGARNREVRRISGGGVWSPRPTGAGHGVQCMRDVEDAVPYEAHGGRGDAFGTMWASSPTHFL